LPVGRSPVSIRLRGAGTACGVPASCVELPVLPVLPVLRVAAVTSLVTSFLSVVAVLMVLMVLMVLLRVVLKVVLLGVLVVRVGPEGDGAHGHAEAALTGRLRGGARGWAARQGSHQLLVAAGRVGKLLGVTSPMLLLGGGPPAPAHGFAGDTIPT